MDPQYIVIHASASSWGTWKDINAWHKQRGWGRKLQPEYAGQWILKYGFLPTRIHIGYHAVVCNGFPAYGDWDAGNRRPAFDGKIEPGRPDRMPGAHCLGRNYDSLGVCLIHNPGFDDYTEQQWSSLIHYCATKIDKHSDLSVEGITQHSVWDKRKPLCASLNIDQLQGAVDDKLRGY
ncbi:MAG TPA: hypothetical protein DG761_07125 [Gammaproteobacteria bacterium]|nr:hypothetical protein [Gammaproteobacteria bacterium]|tara:strand:- start:919 stop:1452 length:534 start_codon:yes stop_codon:yes gene_type:complete